MLYQQKCFQTARVYTENDFAHRTCYFYNNNNNFLMKNSVLQSTHFIQMTTLINFSYVDNKCIRTSISLSVPAALL